ELDAAQYLLTDPRDQELRCDQIHVVTQKFRELPLNRHEVQARHVARLKLHQHVDVTVRAKIVAKRRAEHGEALDVILLAEFSQCPPIDRDVRAQSLSMI